MDKQGEVILHGRIAEFREALKQEINHIEKNGLTSINLLDGRLVNKTGLDYQYGFKVDYAPNIPTDTPCTLRVGKEKFDVNVVSFDGDHVIVSSRLYLTDFIGKAQLDNGSTVFMERLIRRLENNAEKTNHIGDRLFRVIDFPDRKPYNSLSSYDILNDSGLEPAQFDAVMSALCNDITYIWGPPGTGKTRVIGTIINYLYKQDRSILLASHTNTAVDEAIKKFQEWHGKDLRDDDYPILRLGTSQLVLSDKRLSLDEHVRILGKELWDEKVSLESESKEKESELAEIELGIKITNWLKSIPNRISDLQMRNGSIVNMEAELNNKTQQLEKYRTELKLEKAKKVQFSDYFTSVVALQNQTKIYTAKLDIQTIVINTQTQLNREIEECSDNILHHKRFAELEQQKAQFVSPIEQRRIIQNLELEIEQNTKRKDAMPSEIKELEQKLENYNQKNRVVKLLSGINGVELENKITNKKNEYRKICDELTAKTALKEQYTKRYQQYTLIVQEQGAIRPTSSLKILTEKRESLNRELETVTAKRKSINNECETLNEKISKLQLFINETERDSPTSPSEIIRAVDSLEKKITDERAKIEHSTKYLYNQKNEFSSKLEQEYFLYPHGFGHISEVKMDELLPFLKNEIGRLKKEYPNLDVNKLELQLQLIMKHLNEINTKLSEITKKISELEREAVLGVKILGTTLTKAYSDDVLYERTFDTIIVDEASMAAIPALWCTAYLADKNIVVVGDFKQLSPIAIGDTPLVNKWLGTDIFAIGGMQRLQKEKRAPENFVALVKQFRMEKRIADIANRYYREENIELISDDNDKDRIKRREEFYLWYNGNKNSDCINIINTKELHAWVTGVTQGRGHSRLNHISATLCVNLAFKLIQNLIEEKRNYQIAFDDMNEGKSEVESPKAKILIVSPYRPHTKRIEKLIELEYKALGFKDDLNLIKAGTIHSFQGNEADIVIFDLVIDEPHWKANLFMNTEEVDDGMKKMFNVAITRAKFKLFIVGNIDYCRSRSKDNALGDLLKYLIDKKKYVPFDAKTYFPDLIFEPVLPTMKEDLKKMDHLICKSNFFDYIKQDFQNAKEEIIIYSAFMTEQRLSLLLPVMIDALARGCIIIVVTKPLAERGKSEYSSYSKCETELREIGVGVIHKKGMHEKLVFIDKKIIWCGSLNVLSYNDSTGEIMERRQDKELYADFAKQMDVTHLLGPLVKPEEKTCPICGDEMIAAESDGGGFYWQCINKDFSRNVDQPHPLDGELRCKKCNGSLVFSMKNEPRWICSIDDKHYQKVRKGDLRLEKMLNKIPKKEQRKVQNVFEKKAKEKLTKI